MRRSGGPDGRWMTQLGRAFNKKGDHAASLAWTRKGVEAGHPFRKQVQGIPVR